MAYLDLSRAVRGVDSLLRLRLGIEEFTDDSECIFRLSASEAARSIDLSDGTRVRAGDPVLHLHFWNEHLPAMPPEGPSPGWAGQMARRLRHSLATVARHLERDPRGAGVVALHGAPPFSSRLGAAQVLRTARRFGFDVIDPERAPELKERLHLVLDSMLMLGLAWAFNPPALHSKGLLRRRHQLWISRARLLARYAAVPASRH